MIPSAPWIGTLVQPRGLPPTLLFSSSPVIPQYERALIILPLLLRRSFLIACFHPYTPCNNRIASHRIASHRVVLRLLSVSVLGFVSWLFFPCSHLVTSASDFRPVARFSVSVSVSVFGPGFFSLPGREEGRRGVFLRRTKKAGDGLGGWWGSDGIGWRFLWSKERDERKRLSLSQLVQRYSSGTATLQPRSLWSPPVFGLWSWVIGVWGLASGLWFFFLVSPIFLKKLSFLPRLVWSCLVLVYHFFIFRSLIFSFFGSARGGRGGGSLGMLWMLGRLDAWDE